MDFKLIIRVKKNTTMDAVSLSTLSINTANSNRAAEVENVSKCQSIINCLFGEEYSAKRVICYVYGLFCVCLFFGAIILTAIHPLKKRQKSIVYLSPEHI